MKMSTILYGLLVVLAYKVIVVEWYEKRDGALNDDIPFGAPKQLEFTSTEYKNGEPVRERLHRSWDEVIELPIAEPMDTYLPEEEKQLEELLK